MQSGFGRIEHSRDRGGPTTTSDVTSPSDATLPPYDGAAPLVKHTSSFLFQIVPRCEDFSGEDVALNLGDPEFDLVQAGVIGRREVQLHSRMVAEKSLHLFGLVRREIIEDHIDGLLARLRLHVTSLFSDPPYVSQYR